MTVAYDVQKNTQLIEDLVNGVSDGKVEIISNDLKFYYISTLVDPKYISENIKIAFNSHSVNFDNYFQDLASQLEAKKALQSVLDGNIVALYKNNFYEISEGKKQEGRSVATVERESALEGSLSGLIEKIDANINLIRQYYNTDDLIVKLFSIGTKSKAKVSILYDKKLVDMQMIDITSQKLNNLNAPIIQTLSELQQYLLEGQALIPRLAITERPDKAARELSRGKMVILLNGTPSALIGPTTFHDFMKTVDDYALLPFPSIFLIALRYAALFVSIVAPGLYVGFTAYNPEIFRVQLALSIAGDRSGISYPSFLEVLIMLITMEVLMEASLRLPKTIGGTVTTVGGLILGQAATQAQLVSNIMVIVVSAVVISNFVIPTAAMNFAIRLIKYMVLIMATLGGIFGLMVGVITTANYLFSLHSFNTPFFDPVGRFDIKKLYSFVRRS